MEPLHAPPTPATSPTWLSFELREGIPLCPCVAVVGGRGYAHSSCAACHGGGLGPVAPRAGERRS